MDNRSPGGPRLKRGLKKLIGGVATTAVVASSLVVSGLGATAASAAPDPTPTTISTVGAFSNVQVPAGVCAVEIVALGAGGGSPTWNGSNPAGQAQGGAGARVAATFTVTGASTLSGFVGGGGGGGTPADGLRNLGGVSTGGLGGDSGGHHGGGGGGLTSVAIDGVDAVIAGGGGGAGGGHLLGQGFGGHGGLPTAAGAVAAGQDGGRGADSSRRPNNAPYTNDPTMVPGGGQGGQPGGPGAGGGYTDTANKLPAPALAMIVGIAGSGQTGGAGGIDPLAPTSTSRADSAGGGGGGYTGGGGGAGTYENGGGDSIANGIGAAGGGGGSSWVAANGSGVTSSEGTRAGNGANGANGQVIFVWKACADPEITLEKTADAASFVADQEITYTFDITNSGGVALSNVTLTDALPGLVDLTYVAWPGAPNNDPNIAGNTLTLQPGETAQATAKYTATHADVARGEIVNGARVEGTPPTGANVFDTDEVVLDGPELAPAISILKTANTQTFVLGQTVTYTFVAGNTGNVTLTGVAIVDPLPGLSALEYTWPGTPGTLEPGQQVRATATYTATQADVDRGSIHNAATSTGIPPTPPGGETPPPVTPPTPSEVTITSEGDPKLALLKEANVDVFEAGDTITYTFTAQNTGNVTLTGVTIADPLPGLSALSYDWSQATAEGTLAPTEIVTATATYTATQADVDRGFVHNAATGTGVPPTPPGGETPPPVTTPPAEVTIESEGDPGITLEKLGVLSQDESTITYTFTATNTGDLTLTEVVITDPLTGLSAISYDWSTATAEGTLAPGEHVTGTATYAVTQTDRNAGSVVNLATTEGTPPNAYDPEDPNGPGTPRNKVTDEDPAVVVIGQEPGITLVKTGSLAGTGASHVGDVVTYTFVATNTGNVVLTDVSISDPLTGLSAISYDWSNAAVEGELQPTEWVTGTATYALTQTDIDAGSVLNTATATGLPPVDPENPGTPPTPVTDEDDEVVETEGDPSLSIEKTGAFDDQAVAGETITYGITVTNTGNQTLSDVTITDEMLAHAGVTIVFADDAWPGAEGVLAPTQSVTATAVYTLTQADVNAGHVYNSATAIGTPPAPPGGQTPPPLPPVEDDVDLPIPGAPSIELVKTGELLGGQRVGEQVEYTFVATNTGNVTLTGVTIADPLPGLSALSYDWSQATAAGVLAPGQIVTATALYTLTQADVDNGHVDNTATVEGTPPNAYDPEDPNGPGVPQEPVTDEDSEIVVVAPAASITIVKSGALNGASAAGQTVTYTFTVTNTGDATLTGVSITDPLPGLSALSYDWTQATAEGTLAPGEIVTATAQYTLTQADVDAGSVVNLASTEGTPPNAYDPEDPDGPGVPQEPVTDEDPEIVATPQEPAIQLVKTGALAAVDGASEVGDLVEYTFVATNIGNVTLEDVSIADPKAGLSVISYDWSQATAEGVLAPGESVTGAATYALTQADIDAGRVDNTATATGLPPVDPENPDAPRVPVTDEDDAIVPVEPAAAIELVKTSELSGEAKAGDKVVYTFTGTNTGNVTLTDVEITDPLPGLGELSYTWPGAAGVLAPGAQVIATAEYTLTQADVDAGTVDNTATVIGTPPATYDPENPDVPKPQPPVTDDDSVETPLPAAPAISLVKSAKVTGKGLVGDKVEYAFIATNTGNVTLSGVVITDPLKGLSALSYQWPAEPGVLVPGASVRATASYVLTEADIAAGKVLNTASVIGYAPNGGDPVGGASVTDTDSATVTTGRPPLPVTGGVGPAMGLAAGLGLLLLGAGALLAARTRRQTA